jgi:hypothetical protein
MVRFDFMRITADIGVSAFDQVRTKGSLREEGFIKIQIKVFRRLTGYPNKDIAD